MSFRSARWAVLFLLLCAGAQAQNTFVERIQSTLDEVARGLNALGRKADDIVGPGLGLDAEKPASYTVNRSYHERFPVGPTPTISISNEFGDIRVETWDNRVVEVAAEIVVGAETQEAAEQIAGAVDVNVTPREDHVEVRTFLPSPRRDATATNIAVNYVVTVPSNAALVTDNFFGDTYVQGLTGSAAIEAQYGALDLQGMAGDVNVRTHGEFPVRVSGLAGGGTFLMHGARGEFAGIGETLRISNFRGSVSVRDIDSVALVDVVSDSGPVDITLPPGATPDVHASTIFGNINSDLTMQRSVEGDKVIARAPNPDAPQRLVVSATFADVRIAIQGQETTADAAAEGDTKTFDDVQTRVEKVTPGTAVNIDATTGDVRVEESPGDEVKVTARRIVWVRSAAQAPGALDTLGLHVQRDSERVSVNTVATTDPAAFGAVTWRLDLTVQVPEGTPVNITAQNGLTTLNALRGSAQVVQSAGGISAERVAGPLTLNNHKGDITANLCLGGVDASVRYGTLRLERCAGKLVANCVEGRTIIDSPLGALTVRSSTGDTRILALEGVNGDYDVAVENGNLSLLLAPESDASISVTTRGGIVQSAHELSGTLSQDSQEFIGRLGEGTHNIRLEATNGNVVLD